MSTATYEQAIQAMRVYLNAATGVPLERIVVGDADVVYPGLDAIMVRPLSSSVETRATADNGDGTITLTYETDWTHRIEFFSPHTPGVAATHAQKAAAYIWSDADFAQALRDAGVNVYSWPVATNVSALWSTSTELRYTVDVGFVSCELATQVGPGAVDCVSVGITLQGDDRQISGQADYPLAAE